MPCFSSIRRSMQKAMRGACEGYKSTGKCWTQERMSEIIESSVRQVFPEAVLEASTTADGVLTLKIAAGHIKEVCHHLKETPALGFDYPASITGIDWTDRFEVVYHLTALGPNQK